MMYSIIFRQTRGCAMKNAFRHALISALGVLALMPGLLSAGDAASYSPPHVTAITASGGGGFGWKQKAGRYARCTIRVPGGIRDDYYDARLRVTSNGTPQARIISWCYGSGCTTHDSGWQRIEAGSGTMLGTSGFKRFGFSPWGISLRNRGRVYPGTYKNYTCYAPL